ncbi:hypothetical protein QFZ79_001625 [Arthrobacter sp. V4I6]|uniref:phosphotransferase n=1 Tax=unclassified Arthrobacter TaxID=235627 RepID=UPI00278270ED|nr:MULTISPECIES: phosphotransferase [unclassified Arthrobacter]MDQ0819331.1 hypothetical protein [Arthrobacter sp. V1I7]MDQ0853514.1 hypothetical protein [Arthrobacter sp. V4I6]
MGWHPPVPAAILDVEDTRWQVIRSWPGQTAEDYVLELLAPDRPGVRAAHLRSGQLELLPAGRDRRLPGLKHVAKHGEVVVHRAHHRAVVRAGDQYAKLFRLRQAAGAASRHAWMNELLGPEDFRTPDIVSYTPGCLTLTSLPGRSLFDLGRDAAVSEAVFEKAWQKWAEGWVRQQSLARALPQRLTLEALPPRSAAVELANLRRIVNLWLLHAHDVPGAEAQRSGVRAAATQVAQELLGSEADPLVWSHGDLHDKQIFVDSADDSLGLLDFDESGRAEAAADLANLAMHLQLRLRQQRLSDQRYQTASRQVIAAAEELRVSPARFDAYAGASRLRLGCLYSFRPQWAAQAEDFLYPPAVPEGALSSAGSSPGKI